VLSGGTVLVRDLGSTNRTRINGRRIFVGRLLPGDELAIGDLLYRIADTRGEETVDCPENGDPVTPGTTLG
jgi:pSer/pThr/pTyr-binding forkhead associated (FHA) protein